MPNTELEHLLANTKFAELDVYDFVHAIQTPGDVKVAADYLTEKYKNPADSSNSQFLPKFVASIKAGGSNQHLLVELFNTVPSHFKISAVLQQRFSRPNEEGNNEIDSEAFESFVNIPNIFTEVEFQEYAKRILAGATNSDNMRGYYYVLKKHILLNPHTKETLIALITMLEDGLKDQDIQMYLAAGTDAGVLLTCASKFNRPTELTYLLGKSDNADAKLYPTPEELLEIAIYGNAPDSMQILIDQGMPIYVPFGPAMAGLCEGITPVMYAWINDKYAALDVLLESPADIGINCVVNIAEGTGYPSGKQSILSMAVGSNRADHANSLRRLLNRNDLDVTIPDNLPILYALFTSQMDLVQELYGRGARVSASQIAHNYLMQTLEGNPDPQGSISIYVQWGMDLFYNNGEALSAIRDKFGREYTLGLLVQRYDQAQKQNNQILAQQTLEMTRKILMKDGKDLHLLNAYINDMLEINPNQKLLQDTFASFPEKKKIAALNHWIKANPDSIEKLATIPNIVNEQIKPHLEPERQLVSRKLRPR